MIKQVIKFAGALLVVYSGVSFVVGTPEYRNEIIAASPNIYAIKYLKPVSGYLDKITR